jgi:hypothetical protein
MRRLLRSTQRQGKETHAMRTISDGHGIKTFPAKASIRTDWVPVAAFSLIGLLLALNVMLRFPEWGAMVAELNQF